MSGALTPSHNDVDTSASVRVVFLGTGDAFSLTRASACIALQLKGPARDETVLLDAASGKELLVQLRRAGIVPASISAVVLTHQHLDHATGLLHLLLHRVHEAAPLTVYCSAGALAPLQATVRTLLPFLPAVMADRLHWHPCHDGDEIEIAHGAARLAFFAVDHDGLDALGIAVHAHGRRLVYSGDTRPCESLNRAATGADVLVHEACHLEREDGPTASRPSAPHSTAADAARTASQAGVHRLILTHLGDISPERIAQLEAEARLHFDGPITIAEDLAELIL